MDELQIVIEERDRLRTMASEHFLAKTTVEQELNRLRDQNERLRGAANDVISSASDTYKKRNGHTSSFEDDSGEKCWIVPFDAIEDLRAALSPIEADKELKP